MITKNILKYVQVCVMIIFTILIALNEVSGQVRIGPDNTTSIASGAMFEVASSPTSQKGFLCPRISVVNALIWGLSGTATDGMMVYNTNTSIANGSGAGLYLFYNSRWNRMVDEAALAALPQAMVSTTVTQGGAASGGGFVQNQNYAITYNTISTATKGVGVSADGVKFTVLTPGYYLIAVNFRVFEDGSNTGATTGQRFLSILKNATYDANYFTSGGIPLASSGMTTTGISSMTTNVMTYLAVGDTILSNFVQTSNATNIRSSVDQVIVSMQMVKCSD